MELRSLDKLPRHSRGVAPYPPARVAIHLHSCIHNDPHQAKQWKNDTWKIIKDPVCGWEYFGYTFVSVPRCADADVCLSLVESAAIARHYGIRFAHLSLTQARKKSSSVRVWINADNWYHLPPTTTFQDLDAYRAYLIHHELGHAVVGLQHWGEDYCWSTTKPKGPKRKAPIMLQQTLGTGENCSPSSCVADTIARSPRAKS